MRTLFGLGLAILAVALVITTWSVEPTVGKTPTVSVDPLGLMTTTGTAEGCSREMSYLKRSIHSASSGRRLRIFDLDPGSRRPRARQCIQFL